MSAIGRFLKYSIYGKRCWYIAHCPLYGRCPLFGVSAKRGSTVLSKITGGVAHLMTLGLFVAAGKIRGKNFWPGFTNDEELCVCCNKDPSADACYAVGKVFKLKTKEGEEDINTCHSTTLDRLHIV